MSSGSGTLFDLWQPPAGHYIVPVLRIRPIVADTSALVADIVSSTRSRTESPLLQAMGFGGLRVFIPHHVWAEVPRKLSELGSRGVVDPESAARLWWTRYCSLIRVVDTGRLPSSPAFNLLARRDPSDAPIAALVGLLAPVVVLAGDNDIIDSSLADGAWWIASKSGETLSLAGVGAFSGSALTLGTLDASWKAAKWTYAQLGNPWVQLAVGLVIVGLVITRELWSPSVRSKFRELGGNMGGIVEAVGPAIGHLAEEFERARLHLQQASIGSPGDSIVHAAARCLAVSGRPLTRTELAASMSPDAATQAQRLLVRSLGLAMGECSAFVQIASNRWQLGIERRDFGALSVMDRWEANHYAETRSLDIAERPKRN